MNIILTGPRQYAEAAEMLAAAEVGSIFRLSPPSRTLEQNALFWQVMGDLANAKPEGREWAPETWRDAILHATGQKVRWEEGLDDTGPFPVGFRSSKLSKRQMSLVLDYAFSYGARCGVVFTIDRKRYGEVFR